MTFLERIQIQRADEQVAAVKVGNSHERDSWAVRPASHLKSERGPRFCSCGKPIPARSKGLCRRCYQRAWGQSRAHAGMMAEVG